MKTHSSQAGFTLIEIALAIMVASVGLLSVFSLFPSGMSTNKHAIDDTYAAMFAEEVMHGARAQVSLLADWDNVVNIVVPARSTQMWDPQFIDEQKVFANTGWQKVQYRPTAMGGDAVEYALRYNFVVRKIDSNRASAMLEILGGEFGPTDNPVVVYTEFFNNNQ